MKVLLPIDGSQPSKNTLEWVSRVFNSETTEFYIITVVPSIRPVHAPPVVIDEFMYRDAIRVIREAEKFLQSRGFYVERAEYVEGEAAPAICDYAALEDVDQIIIGSHGKSGVSKLLMGSVSSEVFRCARQPVFVYRNAETEESHRMKIYWLMGANGRQYPSTRPGTLGGNQALKIYGRLDCPSAMRWIAKGHYVKNRVFFDNRQTAIKAGYRPCGVCLQDEFVRWKDQNSSVPHHAQS
jgi:nucleotide-binding universal stress UspA family protein